MSEQQRKLATIMAVDVAGYSRAAEVDDHAAAEAVARVRAAIDDAIKPNGGRVFNTAGDGFMVELPAASSGVAAAQALLAFARERSLPRLRIGVHLGDAIVAPNGDLLGHGVNVAARLMQMAEPNTAVVSQAVQTQLRQAASVQLRPLGRVQLDKMSERVEVFAIADKDVRFGRIAWKRGRLTMLALAGVAVVSVGGFVAWRIMQPPTTPRLAVLQFERLGNTPPYLSEGVADELISEISRIEGMEVTARASSFALTGGRATPANAAHELGATLVLTGSVRESADEISVDAQLVEAPSGRTLWTQTFARPAAGANLLEHDIAIRVAQAADARVTAPPPQSVDPAAYQIYLQGRELQLAIASVGWSDVRDKYQEAVTRDPHFAEAWAALARAEANVQSERNNAGTLPEFTDAALAPSLAAADRAIALDGGLAEPYLVRALVYSWLGHWKLAAQAAADAERRGGATGNFYRALGYMQKAVNARKHSSSLDPLSATEWNNLAYTCEYNGDVACQLDAAQRAHDLAPDDVSADVAVVRGLAASNRGDDAFRFLQNVGWLRGDLTLGTRTLLAMSRHGRPPGVNEILAEVNPYNVDNALRYLADTQRWDAAAHLLDRWDAPERSTLFTLFRVQWAPLQRTPQFWALMKREGLVQYWRESGQWPDFCAQNNVCEPYKRPR